MNKMDFRFEFGRVNLKLYKKVNTWKEHEGYGGYVLVGPSGSGKTLLLNELGTEIEKSEYMHGYEVLEGLYGDIRKGRVNPKITIDESSVCLLIDHFDDINGKVAITDEIRRMLKRAEYNKNGVKRLIICTFVNEKVAEDFALLMNYEILRCNHVKPNLRIIREKARDFGFRLTEDRIRDYSEFDTMFELRQAFREIERDTLLKEHMSSEPSHIASEYKLILTSRGLNTVFGKKLMKIVFTKEKLKPTSIFLMTLPSYGVDEITIKHCRGLGFNEIYMAGDFEGKASSEMPSVEYIFVTEGNTFEVVDYIRQNHFDEYIKKQVIENKATYIGSSAGAIYAACSFKEAENFDSNFVGMTKYKGLMLMPHKDGVGMTVIPHYAFDQLKTYISNMDEIDKSRYSEILNVANEEALILDCKRTMMRSTEVVELVKMRSIRLES